MIKVLIGDIFKSEKKVLVNTVNCIGIMGKGIAKSFKSKYPEMFADYKERCINKLVKPGKPYIFEHKDFFGSQRILNFPTKNHWRSPSKIIDIINGLDYFITNYPRWGITSIAFPPLGCGSGGLDWNDVGKIMYNKLSKLDIDIEIYAPFGTSEKQISIEFLSQNQSLIKDEVIGITSRKIRPEWLPIIDCVYQMQKNKYSPKVGRVKFQKIAYLLTELGIETGLSFRQGTYGPYSENLKELIHIFSNSNLIKEEKLGKMTNLIVNDEFEHFRKRYSKILETNKHKILKTADLFERVKTTDKAEEVTSIIYSLQKLKNDQEEVSDLDVLKSLLEWKKRWNTEEKRVSLVVSIRNLAILKWIKIQFSPELNDVEIF